MKFSKHLIAAALTTVCAVSAYAQNVTVTVTDGYSPPYPAYVVKFQIPTPTPILFDVSMQANADVPSNGAALVQAAIIAAFNGEDGGTKARIGSTVFASRYYAGIVALGAWARIYSVQVGILAANLSSVPVAADRIPTISALNISVTFS